MREISIMSSEPLEEWEFAQSDHETVMPWIAVIGAGLGLTGAYLLTSLTQQAWPINTGGMPIVTNWTNIIIMFELTMLGAVLATVLTLFMTARLPGRLPRFYDPADCERQNSGWSGESAGLSTRWNRARSVSTNAEIIQKLGESRVYSYQQSISSQLSHQRGRVVCAES